MQCARFSHAKLLSKGCPQFFGRLPVVNTNLASKLLLSVSVALASPTILLGDVIVKQGTFATSDGAATTPTRNQFAGTQSDGYTFNNNISNLAPLSGGTVRSVFSNSITNYTLTGAPSMDAQYTLGGVAHDIVLVGGIEGSTTAGNTPVFTATSGYIGFFAQPVNTYVANNPSTWGATNASTGGDGLSLLTPIAIFQLKPAEPITDTGIMVDGGPGTFNTAQAAVNKIAIDIVNPALNQGIFLFEESTAVATLEGTEYIDITGINPGTLPSNAIVDLLEDLAIRVSEQVQTAGLAFGMLDGTDLNVLNTIASQLAMLSDLGGANTGFATGLGPGTATTFNSGPGPGLTSDIETNFGVNGVMAVQFQTEEAVVPEPSSILIWGVGLALIGGLGCRRACFSR